MSQKANIVNGATGGRESSTKKLTFAEAQALIAYLNGQATPAQQTPLGGGGSNKRSKQAESANKMRRNIIAYAHRIGWQDEAGKADMKRLNEWCQTKSYLKKPLNKYTYEELPKLVSQFKEVYKYYISNTNA